MSSDESFLSERPMRTLQSMTGVANATFQRPEWVARTAVEREQDPPVHKFHHHLPSDRRVTASAADKHAVRDALPSGLAAFQTWRQRPSGSSLEPAVLQRASSAASVHEV
jgi:hypothetical protein